MLIIKQPALIKLSPNLNEDLFAFNGSKVPFECLYPMEYIITSKLKRRL